MDFAKALRRGLALDKVNEKDLQVLQEMFQGSDLSRSVYTTVLEENNGKLDAAIDTLLNLANDPLHEQPTAQEAQPPPPATQEAPPLLSEHVASPAAPPCLEPAQAAQPLVPSPVEEAPLQLSVTADSNLTSSPATSSSPVLSRAALPVFAPSEVLSVLQTQVIMADDFITSLSPPVAKSLPGPLPLQQSPSMCKLVCPTSARQGDVVGVSWDLGPDVQPSPKDWIGLFQQNQPSNTQYVYYKKTGGDRRGILDVRSPGLGTWEFRFFPNGTYNCMMKSNLLIIGPQLELEATLCEEEASNESNIVVSCRVLSGQVSSSDWIGLYNVETYDNTTYLGLRYVENVDGLATARFTFPAPRKPGHYELRYFPAASAYNDVARSNLITVEDRDVLIVTPSRVVAESDDKLMATWQVHSVPTSKWDWVGLFAVGSSTYVEYHYVDPTKEELACQFAVPRQPGHYELRYHASATSSFLDRRSSRITVLAPSSRVSSSASSC